MEKQLEIWKNNKIHLLIVMQEGNHTYSIYGYIKDFSEKELILQTDNDSVQIVNRNYLIKVREVRR